MITRRHLGASGALLPLLAMPWKSARAQRLIPDGPVTIVVPYTPGTGPDILSRLLAPSLQQRFAQSVVVDNRPGASGNIGTQFVARAAPDGRTLMLQPNTFVMNPSLFQQVPYDPIKSFTPIILLSRGDLVMVVNPDVPASDARELAELARAKPGSLDYGSPGTGTPQHLAMALFGLTADVRMNHVPYRGAAPSIQDLIGRRIAAMVLPVHTALPLAQADQLRMLAICGDRRTDVAPDVPTLAEAGFPGSQADLWFGLFGPAELPADFVRSVNAGLNTWLGDPKTRDALRAQGMKPAGGTPEALGELAQRDLARWADVIRRSGISAG
ncbi:tripartite tricarboxylate transporter substrate binding protein [Roseomonas chloroacetimidivorans]|uniref:tripartite tricarboxylate transporter substrate binding protein n=1 Tax=Roseomonas chloroacetimidivorans TaxID=1766656 RepID=UPI003C7190CE